MTDQADPLAEAFDAVPGYAVLVNDRYLPFERSERVPCQIITLSDGKPTVADPVTVTLIDPPATHALVCDAEGAQLTARKLIGFTEAGMAATLTPLPDTAAP